MVVGIGIDVVEIERFTSLWSRHQVRLCESIFTQTELAACGLLERANDLKLPTELTRFQAKYLAERFAAKEATIKVLSLDSSTGFEFADISVDGSDPIIVHLAGILTSIASKQGINRLSGVCTSSGQTTIACIIGESIYA